MRITEKDYFPTVSGKYGAPMGRANNVGKYVKLTGLHLRQFHVNSGGYDSGGAYWGLSYTPRYVCYQPNDIGNFRITVSVERDDLICRFTGEKLDYRAAAKAKVIRELNARYFTRHGGVGDLVTFAR